jgi:hypothetical protein
MKFLPSSYLRLAYHRKIPAVFGYIPCALMNCARAVRLHNEVFAVYYRKKMDEGKPHCVAINHVAKKLVRLIFALETKGERFDPEKSR